MDSGSSLYIGLMSGTSLDGVDIAIVDFSGKSPEVRYCYTELYPEHLRTRIQALTHTPSIGIEVLGQLDIEIARFYAEVVHLALTKTAISASSIAAIGSHGQTIYHNPDRDPTFTLQIGDPNTISARTGITTVADFRRRDMALGGQGAPLAPAFHQHLFRSDDEDRVIINIGGIANLTGLPANADKAVVGFDTGPGNTLMNYWINRHQGKHHDDRGHWAASGNIVDELLDNIMSTEPYFAQKPPKSTGTEYFGPAWLHEFDIEKYKAQDIQASLLELTARTIVKGMDSLDFMPEACFICGGGIHNSTLLRRLQALLPGSRIESTASLGIDPDYVESIAFAWLARQTMNRRPGNLPSVTRADSPSILGGIFLKNSD